MFSSRRALTCLTALGALILLPLAAAATGLHEEYRKQLKASRGGGKLNLGLAYWIELYRGGHFYRTSSGARFQSGDQIRFHVMPNADSYAYIVMRQGSKGTRAILFPQSLSDKNNFVQCGRDCIVPMAGALEFDGVPGAEQVGLLLSRTRIDPTQFLGQNPPHKLVPQAEKGLERTYGNAGADSDKRSDLEKSYDAVFGGAKGSGEVNVGALEVLAVDLTTKMPVVEAAEQVLASPSTVIAVNDDPEAVVSVDFALRHE